MPYAEKKVPRAHGSGGKVMKVLQFMHECIQSIHGRFPAAGNGVNEVPPIYRSPRVWISHAAICGFIRLARENPPL
ncbi:hypothetical protein GF325_12370 [Candidatus Bathyarchaeota archaeon]|nr:hypothetical protein [Candidatus Bathyarchaeota archaeon]